MKSNDSIDEKDKEISYENKCFVIMPISDQDNYPAGHFQKVYDQIFIPAIKDAGYVPYRVDENKICDSIIGKIFTAIQECPMAICDLSSRNPNVLYELGIRQAYDKPVVLIQDDKTDKIFDVSGINTVYYNSGRLYEDVINSRNDITEAINATKLNKSNITSLVRIIRTNKALLENSTISHEDKLEYTLMALANELKDIKMQINELTSGQIKENSIKGVNSIDIFNEISRRVDENLCNMEDLLKFREFLRGINKDTLTVKEKSVLRLTINKIKGKLNEAYCDNE